MNNKRDYLGIVTQAFYGNRIGTEIKPENVDRFILGYQTDEIKITEPIDRTIINLPTDKNIVIIYNKYKEEEKKNLKEKLLKNENYVLKPLAVIPEYNLTLYSRCIACRIDENGEIKSLQDGDYEKIIKYFTE